MEIKVSYFARLRRFAETDIPLSTAMFDPKWFNNYGAGTYFDKRNVINGLRIEPFVPKDCGEGIAFMDNYRKQLAALDKDEIMARFESLERRLKDRFEHLRDKELTFVLMVYEKVDNPLSERGPIKEIFKSWGIECPEWEG